MAKTPKFKLGDKVLVIYAGATHYKLIGEVINIVCFGDATRAYQLSFDSPLVQDGPHWYSENHLVYAGNKDDGTVTLTQDTKMAAKEMDKDSIDSCLYRLKTMGSIRKAAKMTSQATESSPSKAMAKLNKIFASGFIDGVASSADFVEKIIVNGPKTIVLWNDGTKTIVSCREGEAFDIYTAFCAALAKKMFGSTSRTKAILEDKLIIQEKKDKKKPDAMTNGDLFNESIQNVKSELIKSFRQIFDQIDQ